jgi:enoyl-CoA hydratase/carnithine racemase
LKGDNTLGGFETIIYSKKDGIGYVTLNRPEALNAFNIQMRDELYEILNAIRDDDEVKVAILNGNGDKAFCAGADLSEFLTAPSPVEARRIRYERDVWSLFLSMPQPFIAALHGYVLGSGIEMGLCCDIRLASEDASFGLPEVELGIIPAAGGTQTLPRVVGRGKALEMLLTSRRIDAHEAHQIQLVNRVVARNNLLKSAKEMAEKIAGYDPIAVRYAKQAIVRGIEMSLDDGLYLEKMLALCLTHKGTYRKDTRK